MSAIFGICHIDRKPAAGDLGLMSRALDHWHADDHGSWVDESIGLGQLMLYNTPESLSEKLPAYDSSSQLAITADARIDNREQLCRLLDVNSIGNVPDSSLILLLYQKFGVSCVSHLVGDFAFAIWDQREQKLFCARDHMGVKPFFYYCSDKFFAFASEKKGLLCLPGIDTSIDKQFFYNQALMPRVQSADATIYKQIRRLPPAHTLVFAASKKHPLLHQYWTLDALAETKFQRKEEYYEGFRHHFENAVKCRLRTHYPIGAELSGGMDSSAIAGVASVLLKRDGSDLLTFSNVAETGESEREYAAAVIKFNEIKDYEFISKDLWDDPIAEIDFALAVNDGLEMWSQLWQLPLKHAAWQKQVRTLLSGFPGDEMVTYRGQFAFLDHLDRKEYGSYFSAKKSEEFRNLKPFVPPGLEFGIHQLKNILATNSPEIRDICDLFGIPASGRYSKGNVVWDDVNFRERFVSYRHYQKYRLLKPQVALRMEAETRFGMAFRMEPRFPLADIRLTQYYLSMPNYIKYEGAVSRNAWRQAVSKYVPQIVLERDDKSGTTAPFRMNAQSMDKRMDALRRLLQSGRFQPDICERILKQVTGKIAYQVSLLELLRWYETNTHRI